MESEYKEGREYILSRFIKEGSYGEVHSAQDVKTGFRFAAKKVNKLILPTFYSPLLHLKCRHLGFHSVSLDLLWTQIALKRFSSEEVGAWSTLRSPRITELFGVVREGPNVVLFMEEKSGKEALFFSSFFFKQHSLLRRPELVRQLEFG